MYNICICDDENVFLNFFSDKIHALAKKNKIDINICKYLSGVTMLFNLEENHKDIDIFFLDVLMDELNGVEIANWLRKMGNTSQIIFVSSCKDYVFKALNTMPLHYLIKNEIDDDVLESILLKAIRLCERDKKQRFSYKIGHSLHYTNINEIVYFESENRVVRMQCCGGNSEVFYMTMSKLEDKLFLECNKFIRIHKSYVVNLDYVKSIKAKEIVCYNDIKLPIGEKYRKKLNIIYTKFLLKES